MASTKEILKLIEGTNHVGGAFAGLAAYHAAKAVVNANRRVGTARRANAMRKALKQFNVMVSYDTASINGPIRLFVPTKRAELILNAS
jgi:hypothetical protein